jgi:effector-binding domain-containing protein
MLGEVVTTEVEPRRLAVLRRQATLAELGPAIMGALDIIWPFLRENSIPTGHNVILYHDQVFNMDIGVEIFAPLPAHESIFETETPGGRVATVDHYGPYEELPFAHTAIARQCIASGLKITGMNWEVYGDWTDDSTQLRTDVFYQLADVD